jgi:hypothetical protein
MSKTDFLSVLLALVAWLPAASAQVIPNGSFENGLAGWTVGGTGRVAAIQGSDVTGTGANVEAPDGSFFAALSTGPGNTGGPALRIDANTVDEFDMASLAITVSIPFRPAVLAFDWTFPTSEQDQPAAFDDLFDVMVYAGAPPADPTTAGRVFARSSPRNTGTSISNFPDAHILGTQQITWTITGAGSAPITNTALRFRVPPWRRACVAIPLPDDVAPPFTRTVRFRVADQSDAGFDSALFLDRVEIRQACDATPQERVAQITETAGSELTVKNGGFEFQPVQTTRLAVDPSGTVVAVASNANLDGSNPNLVEQVFIRVGQGGWQRVTGLPMQKGGVIQGLALSGQTSTGPAAGQIPGRYLAIAARVNETDNTEIYRWDRFSGTLVTVTSTSGCHNRNPAINRGGDVIAFDSDCAALTGAGTHRHVLAWAGGATNVVGNISGTGACTARNAYVNHHADNGARDGRYVVYEANCNHGQNADGNQEIFRFNRNTGNRRQITVSSAPVLNHSPQIDRDNNGRNVYFVSNGNYTNENAQGAFQLFRFQCNDNANCTGSTGGVGGFFQWTQNPPTSLLLAFRQAFEPAPGSNATVTRFAFERYDLLTGASEIGYQAGTSSAGEDILALQASILGLGIGWDGVPVVGFLTPGDLIDQNPDSNIEAYSVRVE